MKEQKHSNLFDDMMEIALRIDKLERMYQIQSDKRPVVEFYFEDISDLARMEASILTSMGQVVMQQIGYDRIPGHSEFSNCREYTVGPITYRLRCEKVLASEGGKRLGVRDILFTHKNY